VFIQTHPIATAVLRVLLVGCLDVELRQSPFRKDRDWEFCELSDDNYMMIVDCSITKGCILEFLDSLSDLVHTFTCRDYTTSEITVTKRLISPIGFFGNGFQWWTFLYF
jgi:hypothetical protein